MIRDEHHSIKFFFGNRLIHRTPGEWWMTGTFSGESRSTPIPKTWQLT